MYIYKIYKNKKDLSKDLDKNKLHKDYLFSLNRKLYKMIDGKNYSKISYFEYISDFDKRNIESLCNLEYDKNDIIKIVGRSNKKDIEEE